MIGSIRSLSRYGLRETAADRTNLALANAGAAGAITLRVSVFAGDGSGRSTVLHDIPLAAGQWRQLDSVLSPLGFDNGTARVTRVAGTEPFVAYAVVNDNVTNDGSYVPADTGAGMAEALTLPVVVETGAFTSELVLANPSASPVDVWLEYVESLAPPIGLAGTALITLLPREQRFVPSALDLLRGAGVPLSIGVDRAGTLTATFARGDVAVQGFLGARTTASDSGEGRYGVYYGALGAGRAARDDAWIFGLTATATTRSHVAFASLDAAQSVSLRYEVLDGASGAPRASGNVTLPPGGWLQVNNVLAGTGATSGFVHVTRVSGSAPFVAYGVLNDGGSPATGTGDGSYVGMTTGN